MAGTYGVLFFLAWDLPRAIEAEAAVLALEKIIIPMFLVLVLLTATHSVLVHCARRKLLLAHFFSALPAAEALTEVVLNSSKGAIFALPAVRVQSWAGTVIVQVGPFVTLRTANGIVLRVAVFSLGTLAVSFLPVPEVRDQSSNPGGGYFHQQSQEHQWQQQARHGGEAHVRPAVTSHSPIRAQAVAAVAAAGGWQRQSPGMSGSAGPKWSLGLE